MWMDYESEMGALSSLTAIKNFAMLALASRRSHGAIAGERIVFLEAAKSGTRRLAVLAGASI